MSDRRHPAPRRPGKEDPLGPSNRERALEKLMHWAGSGTYGTRQSTIRRRSTRTPQWWTHAPPPAYPADIRVRV